MSIRDVSNDDQPRGPVETGEADADQRAPLVAPSAIRATKRARLGRVPASARDDVRADVLSLSELRAARVRHRTADPVRHGASDPALPQMLDAVRAVVRDEMDDLRRELSTQVTGADEIMTMDGVARLLRVSSKTVLSWIRARGLPAAKIGVEWRFRRSAVVRWIGEHHVR